MTYLETLQAEHKARRLRLDPRPLLCVIEQLEPPPPKEPAPTVIKEFPKEWLGRAAGQIWREINVSGFVHIGERGEMEAQASLDPIVDAVAEAYGLTSPALKGQRRDLRSIQARQVSYLLCQLLTQRSLPEIGRAHGGRDHATISHGLAKLAWLGEELEAAHTLADPTNAWVATAVRFYAPVKAKRNRPDREVP